MSLAQTAILEANTSEFVCFPEQEKVMSIPNELFSRYVIWPSIDDETMEIIAIANSSPSYDFLKEDY